MQRVNIWPAEYTRPVKGFGHRICGISTYRAVSLVSALKMSLQVFEMNYMIIFFTEITLHISNLTCGD